MKYKLNYLKKLSQVGYSAIELLMVIGVVALVIILSITYSNGLNDSITGQTVAEQAVEYAKAANRYLTTHYNLLQELLSSNGQSNGLVITVPLNILQNEGYITKGYSATNLLNQIPCVIITWNSNQLQSFLYYRSTNNSKTLSAFQLSAGLQHVGAMIGLYQNGFVISASKDWQLSIHDTTKLFIAQGSADPSQGDNPSAYMCSGSHIANNSYVINMTTMLELNNRLANDDTLHQYADNLNPITDLQNANTMQSNLNMDYTNKNGQKEQSSLIFQMNPNCVMDPSNPATMQDYSSTNTSGCRNRQLALQAGTDNNGVTMTVTGFESSASTGKYVGNLSAASIQPTAQVPIGTACQINELGKMAKQAYDSSNPEDVNNLYISQVQCMVHPLCPPVTNGRCYMPINTVTIQINTPQSSYSSITQECPAGTFVSNIDADSSAITPSACCGSNLGFGFCCHIDNCNKGSGSCSQAQYINQLSSQSPVLYGGITTTPSVWYQGCPTVHSGCSEGWGQVPNTYIVVRSITCTNDISKVGIVIQK